MSEQFKSQLQSETGSPVSFFKFKLFAVCEERHEKTNPKGKNHDRSSFNHRKCSTNKRVKGPSWSC